MRVRKCKAACIPGFVLLLFVLAQIPARAQAWPNGYSYRRTITIDHTKVPNTDQSNFPFLFSGTYSYLATTSNGGGVANSNGYDIIFASDVYGLNVLPFEQESYNATTGGVIYWVQVPTVSHTTDTVIYLFYGNSSITTDQSNHGGVWDSNFKSVWHVPNGATLSASDSTPNGNNATNNSGVTAAAGQIDGGAGYSGNNGQYLSASDSGLPLGATARTLSAWFKASDFSNARQILFYGTSGTTHEMMSLRILSATSIGFESWSGDLDATVSALSTGTWYQVAATFDGTNGRVYLNGSLVGGPTGMSLNTVSNALYIGHNTFDSTNAWNGVLDELRISNVARSGDWISTEYNNQSSPATFYSAGTATSYTGPSISSLSPTSGNLGSSVTITGTNFGSPQGSSTVTFAGTSATTTSWSSTQIIATVPTGILSGNVIVTVASQPSNGVRFTVTGGPWSNGYGYQRSVTIDHTKIPNTDQANFPLLFSGRYPYLATTSNGGGVTNSNGYDIIFALDAAGTRILPFEQESYDPSTGTVNYWVQIPSLSHTFDTVIFMFFGNSSVTADQSNKHGVWDSNFVVVSHLSDNATNTIVSDSTSNGNNLTNQANTSGKSTVGEISNGLSYNGSSDYSSVANNSSLNIQGSAVTVEVWAKPTNSTASTYEHMIAKEYPGNANPYLRYGLYRTAPGSSQVTFHISTGGSGSFTQVPGGTTAAGTWMHIVGVYNGSTATLYINGSSVNSVSASGNLGSSATPFVYGADTEISGEYFNGVLDEARVSNNARSADWIAAEYTNQASPWLFYDEGSPAILSLSPSTGYFGTSVTISGRHFGSSQGTSTVTFSGTAATVTSWTDTSIVVTVPLGAASGNVVVTVAGIPSRGFNFTVFPTGWSDQDVGSVGKTGSASFGNDTFTLNGDGSQLWNTADSFNLAYQSLSGDGTIIARLVSLQGTSNLQGAGIMIRETLTAGSTYAAVDYTNNGHGAWYPNLLYRATTGGSTSIQGLNTVTALPTWMKLMRSGNSFTAYTSTNATDWTQFASASISMATSVYIGLFVNSGDTSSLATATFDNVSVSPTSSPAPVITSISATTGSVGSQVVISGSGFGTSQGSGVVLLSGSLVTINFWSATSITITVPSGATSGFLLVSVAPDMDSNSVVFTVTSQPLPFSWLDDDIGAVGVAGSATFSDGTFTVNGAGSQIWNSADGLHFVYEPLSGNGMIVARLVSFSAVSNYGSAGVMIRETLATGSAHGDVDRTNLGQGYYYCNLTYRTTTNGSTANQQGPLVQTLPYWMRVVRNGNNFTGYTSPDGLNWTQVGTTQTISMATTVYVGLVVSSGSTSAVATATFDHVLTYRTGEVSGTITKASDGTALSGASIQAMQWGAVQRTTTSDSSGNYAMYLPGGSYDIKVSASGYGTSVSNAVLVPVDSIATLNVSLSAPGSISGTVTQSDGVTPIQGATVQALSGDAAVSSISTGSNGTYTISGLSAGSYQVQASAGGFVAAGQSASVTANGTATANFSLQSQTSGAVSYIYDPIGRLVGVVNPSGNTAIYNYDAVGNLLSISQQSSSSLELISFTPGSGVVGSAVTIYGTGFSSTASQDTVKFNGVQATVTSASATQLSMIVPIGASTGTISVTTSAGTVTSSSSFTVTNP